jgi:hypothetical protein
MSHVLFHDNLGTTNLLLVLEILWSLLQHKNTVTVNVETLNGKTDVQPLMDPFLRSGGNMGESQPGGSHFLTSFKILGNCALSSFSDLPYWGTNEKSITSGQPNMELPFLPGTCCISCSAND